MKKQRTFQHFVRALALPMLSALAALMPATAQAQFGGGSGTSVNPYKISTTEHMTELANEVNGGKTYSDRYFSLERDLDYSGKTYTIIADQGINRGNVFRGKFNGNGHTISGITLDRMRDVNNSMYIGLFGRISSDAVIENLTLSASTIKTRVVVGGIVGEMSAFWPSDTSIRCVVRNCHVTSDVTIETINMSGQNSGCSGGIVGFMNCQYDVIENCTSAATIVASSLSICVGGIAGYGNEGTIIGCVFTGTISGGTEYVGGILGNNYEDGATLSNNYVGGNCTIGAVGVSGSTQGTDEGVDVTHLYTVRFLSYINGEISSQPTKTISGTNYYAASTPITLSGLYTSGTPVVDGYNTGTMWNFRANIDNSNYVEVLPQEDGSWKFTMPAANVTIVSQGVKDIRYENTPNYSRVTLTPSPAFYTGTSQKPTVGVMCRARDLTEGTDFITDIPTAGYTNPGDYTFHIWGIGNYGGMRTETFTISPAALTQLTLNEISVYHDGAAHKPTLTVKSGSKTLTRGTEYETDLPDAGFTDLGEYTIKVWGVGNYTDTLTATYTVCHPWEGLGTQQEPFLIKTTDDMDRLASLVNGGKTYEGVYFSQDADLDYSGKTYTPVGTQSNPFNGNFNSYRKFLNVNVSNVPHAGIFGYVSEQSEINGITLSGNSTISGYVSGGIVGSNCGIVVACSVDTSTVTVIGTMAGGIAGANTGFVLADRCMARVTTGGLNYDPAANIFGGLVGYNEGSGDPESWRGKVYGQFQGQIEPVLCGGGIVGVNTGAGVVSSAYMFGSIVTSTATDYVGGIVGINSDAIVENSLSDFLMTDVTGTNVGAIVGMNEEGTVVNCYYIGACRYGGINNADTLGQAMRGWPISIDENIEFHPMPDASGNLIGTYYDDGTNNHYYVGEGETLCFVLFGGTGYTANGTPLTVAGQDDYDDDYYELTMPAMQVHIAPTGLALTLYDKMVNYDNEGNIARADGQQRSVIIEGRTLYKDGEWNTLCLPFAIADLTGTPLEGATVMELDTDGTNGVDNATGTLHLTFKNATGIVAGRPYIIKWDSGTDITDPVFEGVIIDASQPQEVTAQSAGFAPVTFKGTYMFPWVNAYDKTQLFLTAGNQLKYATEERDLLPFRAWFVVDDGTAQSVRGFALDFGGAVVTGMSVAPMLDGSLPVVYDLHGRRVLNPQQGGVYIVNGKKVIF